MNFPRALAVAVAALVVVAAVGYAGFVYALYSADRSAYTATVAAEYDYDAVLENATAAGYDVRRVDSSGYHPDVAELDAELGPGYEIAGVSYYHESGARLDATVFADEGKTELVLWGPDYEPVDPDALPEAWMVERISHLLGVDDAAARGYVDEIRAALTDDDVRVAQTDADERLRFAAVYAAFEAQSNASPVVRTEHDGQGRVVYEYAADGEPAGDVEFVVGRATLTDREGEYTYTLNVDRAGGVGVTVLGPAGKERPDGELRESVRERFAGVGIPPEAADELAFEYDGGVW